MVDECMFEVFRVVCVGQGAQFVDAFYFREICYSANHEGYRRAITGEL